MTEEELANINEFIVEKVDSDICKIKSIIEKVCADSPVGTLTDIKDIGEALENDPSLHSDICNSVIRWMSVVPNDFFHTESNSIKEVD